MSDNSDATQTNETPDAAVETVHVGLSGGRDYDIHIGAGLLDRAGEMLAPVARGGRVVVITQPKIAELYAGSLTASLTNAGLDVAPLITFPAGEEHKTLATVERLHGALYNLPQAIDRKTLVIALGGGVVGDVAGFVAATYLRGLDYVQIPTTLLAMADSSVGGKTGVDFRAGKNLVGAFHQPRAVLADTNTLNTLPLREFAAGMAEVIKYGVIADATLDQGFFYPLGVGIGTVKVMNDHGSTPETPFQEYVSGLRRHNKIASHSYFQFQGARNQQKLRHLLRRSCEIKAEVVAQDEYELTGLRAILNFGHTIGHALESATDYKRYKHGEAVAIGMVSAAAIGSVMGVTPIAVRTGIVRTVSMFGLPVAFPPDVSPDDIIALLGRDKKAEKGKVRFILARAMGDVALYDNVTEADIRAGLARQTAIYGSDNKRRGDDEA